MLGVGLIAAWTSTVGLPRTVDHRFNGTSWLRGVDRSVQYANVEAAAWLRRAHLRGKVGAFDNGWLSFSLDPTPVENLDGLANSYRDLRLLQDGERPLPDVYRRERLRYLVTFADPARVPSCARQLWSSAPVTYGLDPATGRSTSGRGVAIFELSACRRGGSGSSGHG